MKSDDLIEAEHALIVSENRFRNLTITSPNIVFETDKSGQTVFVNDEQWELLTGNPRGSWAGQGWAASIHPDDVQATVTAWRKAVEAEEAFEHEFRFVHCISQRVFWVLSRAVPVHLSDGRFNGHMGSATDITTVKEANEQKRIYEQSLLQTQKMDALGTLAAGVAHDFNNVLTAIISLIEIASVSNVTDDTVRDCLKQIDHAAEQGTEVTKGLLEFLRSSESSQKPIALGDFLEANVGFFKHLIPASVNTEVEIFEKPLHVYADGSRLQQVFTNLIVNALDAMPEGGSLRIQLQQEGDNAQISITDSGKGMPGEVADKIFDPFFTTKAPGVGTGLGLAITHKVITDHGGLINIHSIEEEGTKVTIKLPLVPTENIEPQVPVSASQPVLELETGCALLVDDNPLVRSAVKQQLEALGLEVIDTAQGEWAIQQVRACQKQIAIAIIDIDLPGMDGIQIASKLTQLQPKIAIVLITGNIHRQNSKPIDTDLLVLAKPFKMAELVDAINQATSYNNISASQ